MNIKEIVIKIGDFLVFVLMPIIFVGFFIFSIIFIWLEIYRDGFESMSPALAIFLTIFFGFIILGSGSTALVNYKKEQERKNKLYSEQDD